MDHLHQRVWGRLGRALQPVAVEGRSPWGAVEAGAPESRSCMPMEGVQLSV